jgi:microcin C transport system substrate-binding protein
MSAVYKHKETIPEYTVFTALFLLFCLLAGGNAWPAEKAARPAHGITLWGSLKYPENFKHFDYVNPTAPKGGDVKLAGQGTFDSLNPFIVKGNKAPAISSVFESLMTGALDEPQSLYGLVAKSAVVAADRRWAEFEMRPEARFHDGSPITADDVVFSFDTLTKLADPGYRISYEPIASAVKINEHRVRFNFKDNTKRELPLVAATMPILSKAYYSTRDFTQTTLEPPLASGAYKIKSVEQGRSIVYERVKDYWGANLPVNIGQNNFDTMRYDMYRDEIVALEALKAGEYDFREENVARAWATGYDSPALREGRLKKELIKNAVPQGMQGFVYNVRRDKFSDRRVREAIALTLDFEWMNKTLFFNAYSRNTSYFIHTDFEAKGVPDDKERALLEPFTDSLPPALLTQEFTLPVTDSSGNNRPQLKKADALLTEAGWVVKDGVRVNAKTGEKLTFEFLLHSPVFERVCAPMRKHLKQLGIDASIRVVDEAQYVKRLETYDFDVFSNWINRWVFFPGNEQMINWHSSQAVQEGSNNYAGVKNPAVDALLARIASANSLEELIPAGRALDRVLLFEHYMIPHWNLGAYRVAYYDKFAKPAIAPKYSLGFQTWWIKNTAKDEKIR